MFHVGQWIEEQYLVLERQISRGWICYLVHDKYSDNTFLIKRVSDLVLTDKSAAIRFIGKAKIWINLGDCEELVKAYMVKDYGGIPHLFLEYVHGPTLATILHARPGKALPLEQTLGLMKQLVSGMKFLHGASLVDGTGSVIHGGINPHSILVSEGNIKITNIGLSSIVRQSFPDANTNLLLDENAYLGPEQVQNSAQADEASDIYAFGATLYEVATGTLPAVAKKSEDPLHEFITCNYVPPRLRNQSCPQWLEETILKCMARERENRFQSFEHIDGFLREVLKTELYKRSRLEIEGEPENFSRIARVRGTSKKESRRLNHYYLGVEHLMLGLLAEEESVVVSCFGDRYTAPQLRTEILARTPKGEGPWYWDGILKTPRYNRIMSRARRIIECFLNMRCWQFLRKEKVSPHES